CGQCTHWPFTF
nr:immunoglobulin light chain junction region [Macaca mulatta]